MGGLFGCRMFCQLGRSAALGRPVEPADVAGVVLAQRHDDPWCSSASRRRDLRVAVAGAGHDGHRGRDRQDDAARVGRAALEQAADGGRGRGRVERRDPDDPRDKCVEHLGRVTCTPATGPTTPLGQSGLVWLLVGRVPPPTTAASAGRRPSCRRAAGASRRCRCSTPSRRRSRCVGGVERPPRRPRVPARSGRRRVGQVVREHHGTGLGGASLPFWVIRCWAQALPPSMISPTPAITATMAIAMMTSACPASWVLCRVMGRWAPDVCGRPRWLAITGRSARWAAWCRS